MVQAAHGRYWLLGLLGRRQWLGILLLAMTLASLGGVCGNDFVDYDDNEYVFDNEDVQKGLTADSIAWAFESRDCANWHPLTWLSLELDYEIYGLEPWGFHLTNLLLHAANVLLLFWLLDHLTGRTWRSAVVAGLFAGGVAAAIYAAHCPDDSPLFVALWYSLGIAIVALVGGLAGRLALRW